MIRHLGSADFDIFRRIRLEALRAEPAVFASSAADWEKLPDDEWRRRLTSAAVFVDFHEEEPVAIMGLIRQGASKMAHRATIVMVYVRRDRRGGGHAKRFSKRLSAMPGTPVSGNWSLPSAPKTRLPSGFTGGKDLSRSAA